MELLSGADMIARFLKDEGVEYIYGYPGGAALHIYDALFRQDDVKHILGASRTSGHACRRRLRPRLG